MNYDFDITFENCMNGGICSVIRTAKNVNAVTSLELEPVIQESLEKKIDKIIVDVSKTDYISSAGWGLLLSKSSAIKDAGGEIILLGMNEEVKSTYAFMCLDTILKAFEDKDDAIEYFSALLAV